MLSFNPWKSMTIQGTVGAVAPYLISSFNPSILPPKAQMVVSALGVVWAMFGIRNAVAKSAGEAVAKLGDGILRR
jgi:hypothetical protein